MINKKFINCTNVLQYVLVQVKPNPKDFKVHLKLTKKNPFSSNYILLLCFLGRAGWKSSDIIDWQGGGDPNNHNLTKVISEKSN